MSSSQVKLSWQDGKGWKKSVGKHHGRNGKPQYKMWYLGKDKSIAQELAEYITVEWKQVKRSGADTWTPKALQRISSYRNDVIAPSDKQDKTLPIVKTNNSFV